MLPFQPPLLAYKTGKRPETNPHSTIPLPNSVLSTAIFLRPDFLFLLCLFLLCFFLFLLSTSLASAKRSLGRSPTLRNKKKTANQTDAAPILPLRADDRPRRSSDSGELEGVVVQEANEPAASTLIDRPADPVLPDPSHRLAEQRSLREAEQFVREAAVDAADLAVANGLSCSAAARALDLAPRTLRDWRQKHADELLQAKPLGRPPQRPERITRRRIFAYLGVYGLRVSVHELSEHFPGVSRRQLAEILRRCRYFARRSTLAKLRWTMPGSVWAADYTEPWFPIDGVFPYLLVIRDLGSGRQLHALPVMDQSAETAIRVFAALFAKHGAPLVLKTDNGSAFKAHAFRTLLRDHGVTHLLSPAYTPSYNGSCEAGNGAIKIRALHRAIQAGRYQHWTSDDIEAALLDANRRSRPFGPTAPTPDRAWNSRQPISSEARTRFQETCAALALAEIQRLGYTSDVVIGSADHDMVTRRAVSHALVAHGYLLITRRPITLLIKKKTAARIM